ncbi:MAG: hypothetical protein LBD80_05445 [Tannerella sp.]|jgi:hypothetical protein|nr:hypothetical protein [Tannerella sp.]
MKSETKTKEMPAEKLAGILRQMAVLLEEEGGELLTVTLIEGKSYMKIRGYDDGRSISLTVSNRRAAV